MYIVIIFRTMRVFHNNYNNNMNNNGIFPIFQHYGKTLIYLHIYFIGKGKIYKISLEKKTKLKQKTFVAEVLGERKEVIGMRLEHKKKQDVNEPRRWQMLLMGCNFL